MALILSLKKPRSVRRLSKYSELQKVGEYFLLQDWHWKTHNVVKLYKNMNNIDKKEFNLDLSCFKWEDYMKPYWLGLRKYFLKDEQALDKPIPTNLYCRHTPTAAEKKPLSFGQEGTSLDTPRVITTDKQLN